MLAGSSKEDKKGGSLFICFLFFLCISEGVCCLEYAHCELATGTSVLSVCFLGIFTFPLLILSGTCQEAAG